MKAVVCGANGAMGKLICERLQGEIAGCVSLDGENGVPKTFAELGKVDADVVIDFSHHSAVADVLAYAESIGAAAVIGTTGHTPEEKALIQEATGKIPVFFSGNMSLGIAVLCKVAREAASFFPDADIEIVEVHHNRKVDAPSGTALMLFEAVKGARPDAHAHCGRAGEGKREKKEIGISAVRGGTIVGEHEIIFAGHDEVMEIKHTALSREIFAQGAVEAAKFMASVTVPGLYDMSQLVK